MKNLKLILFAFIVLLAFSCGNNEEKTKETDSTEINDPKVVNDNVVTDTDEEKPDATIMAETLPKTNGVFENAGINSDEQVYMFVREIKANLNNKKTLSEMVSYPISVNIEGSKMDIEDEQAFIEYFDQIFNNNVVTAVKESKYEDLFSNYQGIMIGNGEIWIASLDNELKIFAINN